MLGNEGLSESFAFKDADHTLGNLLRSALMKDPEVEFAGYSVPHPSEPLMMVSVQMKSDSESLAKTAIKKALGQVSHNMSVLKSKFLAELKVQELA